MTEKRTAVAGSYPRRLNILRNTRPRCGCRAIGRVPRTLWPTAYSQRHGTSCVCGQFWQGKLAGSAVYRRCRTCGGPSGVSPCGTCRGVVQEAVDLGRGAISWAPGTGGCHGGGLESERGG